MTNPKLTQKEIDEMIEAAHECKHDEIFFMGVSAEVPYGKCLNCDRIVKYPTGGIID